MNALNILVGLVGVIFGLVIGTGAIMAYRKSIN